MLEYKQYLFSNSKGKEDLWFCKFLKTVCNYSYEHSFFLWKQIYESRYGKTENQRFVKKQFFRYWSNCDFVNLDECGVTITQKDIDFVNSFDIKDWQKKYVLVLVAYYRLRKKTEIGEMAFPPKKLMRYVKRADRHMRSDNDLDILNSLLVDKGIVVQNTKKKIDPYDGEEFEYHTYSLNMPKDGNDSPVIIVDELDDVPNSFRFIENYRVCQNCGEKFAIGPKTKRMICEKCWKEKEKKRSAIAMKKLRGSRK